MLCIESLVPIERCGVSSAPYVVGDGCHVHPHCLTCPLEVCVLDAKRSPSVAKPVHQTVKPPVHHRIEPWNDGYQERYRDAVARLAAGETQRSIARSYGVSDQAVWWWMKRSKAAKA